MLEADGEAIDDSVTSDHYLRRLESGLSLLQNVDYIVAEVVHGCQGQVDTGNIYSVESLN